MFSQACAAAVDRNYIISNNTSTNRKNNESRLILLLVQALCRARKCSTQRETWRVNVCTWVFALKYFTKNSSMILEKGQIHSGLLLVVYAVNESQKRRTRPPYLRPTRADPAQHQQTNSSTATTQKKLQQQQRSSSTAAAASAGAAAAAAAAAAKAEVAVETSATAFWDSDSSGWQNQHRIYTTSRSSRERGHIAKSAGALAHKDQPTGGCVYEPCFPTCLYINAWLCLPLPSTAHREQCLLCAPVWVVPSCPLIVVPLCLVLVGRSYHLVVHSKVGIFMMFLGKFFLQSSPWAGLLGRVNSYKLNYWIPLTQTRNYSVLN